MRDMADADCDSDDYTEYKIFSVKWKNAGAASVDENYVPGIPRTIAGHFPRRGFPQSRRWDDFKAALTTSGEDVRVTYFDDDGDEIPIESQCEFDAFFRYIDDLQLRRCDLIVEKLGVPVATDTTKNTEDPENACQAKITMPPMKLDSCVQEFRQSQPSNNETQAESSGDAPPKWFTNYMQTMKDEIVTEVSERVTKSVLEALSKRQESQYDSAASHLRASDNDYLLDSELDERVSEAENVCVENRDKRDSWYRPSVQRHENSRRRHRHADNKQPRKKPTKTRVFPANPDEPSRPSPSYNRRRGEKTARPKRDVADEPPRSLNNSARPKLISMSELHKLHLASPKNGQTARRVEPNSPRMSCSVTGSVGFTPLVTGRDSAERPSDPPPDYYKLSDSDSDIISIISDVSHTSETLRMNNSFEMIPNRSSSAFNDEEENEDNEERPFAAVYVHIAQNPKNPATSLGFATLPPTPSGNETTTTKRDDRASGLWRIPRKPDDTRDSSSFELLSSPPPSPPLSLHMDADFAAGDAESNDDNTNEDFAPLADPNDCNINDETTTEKRGNRGKIEKCAYAIDAHGRIYQRNIKDDGEDRENGEDGEEIVLEKRTGGAYSFVGETLPAPIKESVVLVAGVSDSSASRSAGFTTPASRSFTAASDDVADAPDEATSAFHESTQSFHSHTAQRAENERQGCSAEEPRRAEGRGEGAAAAAASSSSAFHVFVDVNASKGLGDTKQSSPRQRPTTEKKRRSPEDSESSARSSRRTSRDSSASGGGNANSRQERDCRRFTYWYAAQNTRLIDDIVTNAVDPMHILPETLVTGAVHVASSAYITARKVYDKILTAQTRKHADRSQSKFGRR